MKTNPDIYSDFLFKKFPSFQEFINESEYIKSNVISMWEEIFEEFFEDLSYNQKLKLAYTFEVVSHHLIKDSFLVHLINSFNSANCIELNLFPIIYGVFCERNDVVDIFEILPIILAEPLTKYDYDFTMNVIEKIIKK